MIGYLAFAAFAATIPAANWLIGNIGTECVVTTVSQALATLESLVPRTSPPFPRSPELVVAPLSPAPPSASVLPG